jgi:hypothetical protein
MIDDNMIDDAIGKHFHRSQSYPMVASNKTYMSIVFYSVKLCCIQTKDPNNGNKGLDTPILTILSMVQEKLLPPKKRRIL